MTPTDHEDPVTFHDAGTPEGKTFGGYVLEAEIGRGGMGVVYRALQQSLKRTVALKMLTGVCGATDLARFLAEAETAAGLQHANIVHIYEVGAKGDVPFFAMEYVEGGSLADRLKKGVFPAREAAEMMATLSSAVHFAHEHGVVHRDLKPGNVLLDNEGVPKIADFGIAKRLDDASQRTVTGAIMGTPGYMAPEQAEGASQNAGPQADVYSLGAMLYELLTGRPPFVAHESDTPIYIRVISEQPVSPAFHRPEIPRDLEAICMACLQKDRRDRYASAAALRDDLTRFLNDEPIHAKPPPLLRRSIRWAKHHPWLLAASLIAVVVLSYAVNALWQWEMFQRPRTEYAMSMDVRHGGIEGVGRPDDGWVRHCGIHLRLTRLGRRGRVVKAEVVNAKGRLALVRDVLEYDFLPTWLQGVTGFGGAASRGRETSSVEVSYSGEVASEMVARDRNGRVTFDVRYRSDPGRPRSGIADFRNERGFSYTMPSGASQAAYERDAAGYDVRFAFFTAAGTPAQNGEGVFGYAFERNAAGRLVLLQNLDAKGAPMANLGGVTQVRFEWNAKGQLLRGQFEDAHGRPVPVNGRVETRFTYDAAGNIASMRQLLAEGVAAASRPAGAAAGEQWDVREFAHNDAGEITSIIMKGTGSVPPVVSRIDLGYDDRGFPVMAQSYGADGSMSRRVEFRHDDRGNILEEKKFDEDGDLDDWTRNELDAAGQVVVAEALDPEGKVEQRTVSTYLNDRLVRKTFEYADGKPRRVGSGYTKLEFRYHEHGYRIEERYSGFRTDSLVLRITYDEFGRRTEEVWLGPENKPVVGLQGWVRRRLEYREATPSVLLTDSYESADGNPARAVEGYARVRYQYSASGLLIGKTLEGFDGSQGFSSRRETLNEQGVAEVVEFFDASGGKARIPAGYHVMRTTKYDGSGNATEVVTEDYDPARFTHFRTRARQTWEDGDLIFVVMSYEDEQGRPAIGPEGCTSLERELDEDGNDMVRVQTGCLVASVGAPVWRTEIERNDQGVVRKRTRQASSADRSPLVELGSDRPARVEETLDESGIVREALMSGFSEAVSGYASVRLAFGADGSLQSVTHRRADGTPVAVNAVISEVAADAQKAAAALRKGDVVVSINGNPVASSFALGLSSPFPGGWIEVERDGKRMRIEGFEAGMIGVAFVDRVAK